jgi:hypothetical protein
MTTTQRTIGVCLVVVAFAVHCGSQSNGGPDSDGPDASPVLGLGDGSSGSADGSADGAGGDGSAAPAPKTVSILGPGLTSADRDRVEAATPVSDSAPRIDYPLAHAVMPRTAFAPNVMWTPQHTAQPSDVYRVRLDRGVRRVEGYFLNAAGFTNAWQLPEDAWPVVGDVGFDQSIQLSVAVLSGGVLREGPPLTFRTVDAYLRGSVYYWSPNERRVKRLDVATATVVDFLPNPGSPCVGCHALSRDGRKLAAQEDKMSGDSLSYVAFDLTRDLTGNPAPTILKTGATYGDIAMGYNADATRLIVAGTGQNRDFFPLRILNSSTGALAAQSRNANGVDPEWSPDNRFVAYTTQNGDADDLMTVSVSGDSFGTPTLVHGGHQGTDGPIDWHPTWSPNSAWLAFQNGVASTAFDNGKGGGDIGPGGIWLVSQSGSGARRLDQLTGGAAKSYRPFFTPFDSGGYFWVLFSSTRDYGNASAGVSGLPQVWIGAIADKPDGTSDPSEVPYYLAGQETANSIISPQWAPTPCRANGDVCSAGSDCCSGTCVGPAGSAKCGTATACVSRGGSCDTNADCCDGLACGVGHTCDLPVILR